MVEQDKPTILQGAQIFIEHELICPLANSLSLRKEIAKFSELARNHYEYTIRFNFYTTEYALNVLKKSKFPSITLKNGSFNKKIYLITITELVVEFSTDTPSFIKMTGFSKFW